MKLPSALFALLGFGVATASPPKELSNFDSRIRILFCAGTAFRSKKSRR